MNNGKKETIKITVEIPIDLIRRALSVNVWSAFGDKALKNYQPAAYVILDLIVGAIRPEDKNKILCPTIDSKNGKETK
jgi:hypothetical protein